MHPVVGEERSDVVHAWTLLWEFPPVTNVVLQGKGQHPAGRVPDNRAQQGVKQAEVFIVIQLIT